jgi:S-formylglutathione hydrolase FrmB
MKQLLLLLFIGCGGMLRAASVDTAVIFSSSMQKNVKCVVIKPASYKKKKNSYPVVYLLHGYSGNYGDWVRLVPGLVRYADDYQALIVCPDGGFSSWYFDSPVDSAMRYETHISSEVVNYIDTHYRTIANRQHRAITGLSMGGHGGIFLAWRHAAVFGACGSMSGGVDINACRTKYDISKRIGDTLAFAGNWKKYSVINIIENQPADTLAVIIDCGTEDFFYEPNRQLHQKMLQLHIRHDYIERPGKHDWAYWKNAVPFQLFFFRQYFNKHTTAKK